MGFKNFTNSKLFKSTGIYTVSSVINAAIPFMLIPILTRELSTADYGVVSMAAILINIITPIIGMSAHGAVQRKFFDIEGNDFARYVGNSIFLLLGSAVLVLGLFFFFNSIISGVTEVPGKWLYAILLIGISQFLSLLLLAIWQVKGKAFKYGIFQISQSLINFGITIFLVVLMKSGWEGRIVGQLVAVVIGAFFCILYMKKKSYVIFEFDREYIQDILKFSLPLIPHTLGALIIAFTDRILITNMYGIKETGTYTVAYQIGSVIGILTMSFNKAYIPWLFSTLKKDIYTDKVKIVKFTYLYFVVLILVVILSIYILPWFIGIVAGEDFGGASAYTFWIVLGYAFNGMYLMVTGFLFYVKRTGVLSKITFLTAVLNFPVCYFMLKEYGTVGAAISMSIIFGVSFILTWIFSARVYPMPWFTFMKKELS